MATTDIPHNPSIIKNQSVSKARPVSRARFDLMMEVLAIWFMGGLFLDGWAHTHQQPESFFTPWHLVLYSGFAANATALFVVILRNMRQGYSFWNAIPAGYELGVIGAVIFAFGGAFDMVWHTLLGIEVSLEALVSPAHLVLAFGLLLIMSAPLRAAWNRPNPATKSVMTYLPLLLSLMFTLSLLTFFTFPLHPYVNEFAHAEQYRNGPDELSVMMGLSQILLQTGIMMGVILVAMRRWHLPFGSLTLVLGLNALLLSVITQHLTYVPAAVAAGLLGDTIIHFRKPSLKNPIWLRTFAFAVPATLYIAYFIMMSQNGGVGWSVPFWSGAIVLAGSVGVLLSYVMHPTPIPVVEPQ